MVAPGTVAAPGAVVPNHAFVANAGAVAPVAPAPVAPTPPAAPVYGAGPNSQGHAPAAWLSMPGNTPEALIAGGQIIRVS